jgi:hypothetical protein
VIGAPGVVGRRFSQTLLEDATPVRCLARQLSKLTDFANLICEVEQGDISDRRSLKRALTSIEVVYLTIDTLSQQHANGLLRGGGEALVRRCALATLQEETMSVKVIYAAGAPACGVRKNPASIKVVYTTSAIAVGGRDGITGTTDGSFEVKVTRPEELGGRNDGTNPEQLFASRGGQ